MKLLTLTNRYYFIFILIIVLAGGFLTYWALNRSINYQFNNKLLREKAQLIYELHQYEDLREVYYLNIGDKITITKIDYNKTVPITWNDTLIYDEYKKSNLEFRQLSFSEVVDNQNYQITISKSLLSTDEMLTLIEELMLAMVVTIILSLMLISHRISKKIWQTFYQSLSFLKDYDIKRPLKPKFETTKIDEFKELNEVISMMIEKSINDYQTLKEFTENASHEIQTPLAIIKNRSELLLQNETIDDEIADGLGVIYSAASRLSHLNHDLSFLTKIDNNEFLSKRQIHIQKLVDDKLDQMEDMITMKKIAVKKNYYFDKCINANESLISVLINNLLINAVRHNFKNGTITINITEVDLEIINSGNQLQSDPDLMFERFKKESSNTMSTGLGLALVKKICDFYEFDVTYTYFNGLHKLSIVFLPDNKSEGKEYISKSIIGNIK